LPKLLKVVAGNGDSDLMVLNTIGKR